MKAWELIDAAGCRGLTRGGAQVSEKHCNFLINTGTATAADLEGLGEEVRRRVHAATGVTLEWEIHRIGVPAGKPEAVHEPPARGGTSPGPPPSPLPQGAGEDLAMTAMTRVAVLYGGISAEREVSLSTGLQVIPALREAGFEVTPIEVGEDLAAVIAALTPRPDAVFNALHGRFGEDGAIQGVLDWLAIPYTHSGVRASALAMDKVAAKAMFAAAGLPIARGRVVPTDELEAADPLPLPYVVKPVSEGSSVGVEIIRHGDNRRAEVARAWRFGNAALVEEYIPGRELTVGVMGDRALAVTEIIADAGVFYDYESKYADGGSRHIIPARVHPDMYDRALDVALAAHRALGCRGATRCDFRYDDTSGEPGRLVLLEINTQPGLTPTSLLPEQAAHHGMSFSQLCAWMVENATCRA